MLLQQLGRLDGALVPAIEQRDAVADQRHNRGIGGGFGRGGDQRRHFRQRLARVGRPAGRFANIDEGGARGPEVLRDLGKERRLLRAGHEERAGFLRRGAEALDLGAAEVPPLADARAGADPAHRIRRLRLRVLAGTHENMMPGRTLGHE